MSFKESTTCEPDAFHVGWRKVASARLMLKTGLTGWDPQSNFSLRLSARLLLDNHVLTVGVQVLYIAENEEFEVWLAEQ